MAAICVSKALGIARPAVAIGLLWATCAWSQSAPVPVQGVGPERYDANATAVNTEQSTAVEQGSDNLDDSAVARALTLRLAAGIGYDDNVFRTESNTRSDAFWSVQPAIYLNGLFSKHSYVLGYEGNYTDYTEYSTEDFDDHRIFGETTLDLTRKLDLQLGARYWWGHDPRGSLGNRIIVPGDLDTWQQYLVSADLVIGREITRAQITPSVEFSGMRYTNNNQSIRDFDRQAVGLRGRWRFTPRLYGLAEADYANIDHTDPSNTLDRTETQFLVGVGWLATAKTSGEAMFGILNQDFKDPSQPSGSNFDWNIRIFWEPKPYSKVTLYTERNAMENAGGVGSFLANTYGAEWIHAFTERLDFNAAINYTTADYDSPREDEYLGFELGLTQELTRWLDIGVGYQYLNRRSNVPGLDYDDQIVRLQLTVGVDRSLGP